MGWFSKEEKNASRRERLAFIWLQSVAPPCFAQLCKMCPSVSMETAAGITFFNRKEEEGKRRSHLTGYLGHALSSLRRPMAVLGCAGLKRRFEEVDSESPYSSPKDSDDEVSSSESADSCDSVNLPCSTQFTRDAQFTRESASFHYSLLPSPLSSHSRSSLLPAPSPPPRSSLLPVPSPPPCSAQFTRESASFHYSLLPSPLSSLLPLLLPSPLSSPLLLPAPLSSLLPLLLPSLSSPVSASFPSLLPSPLTCESASSPPLSSLLPLLLPAPLLPAPSPPPPVQRGSPVSLPASTLPPPAPLSSCSLFSSRLLLPSSSLLSSLLPLLLPAPSSPLLSSSPLLPLLPAPLSSPLLSPPCSLSSSLQHALPCESLTTSILRCHRGSSRKRVRFDAVTVFYFSRRQGFTSVPSQGGSSLGMARHHCAIRRYTLGEFAREQESSHRQALRQHLRHEKLRARKMKLTQNGAVLCPAAESLTLEDVSDEELDVEGLEVDDCFFLQPLPTKRRRALLRASGISRIDGEEKSELRAIRLSREECGCDCRLHCDPQHCRCSQAGIKCQVDRMSFPCGCSRDGCGNVAGRIEFNPARVRSHYLHTLLKLEQLERKRQPPAPPQPPEPEPDSLDHENETAVLHLQSAEELERRREEEEEGGDSPGMCLLGQGEEERVILQGELLPGVLCFTESPDEEQLQQQQPQKELLFYQIEPSPVLGLRTAEAAPKEGGCGGAALGVHCGAPSDALQGFGEPPGDNAAPSGIGSAQPPSDAEGSSSGGDQGLPSETACLVPCNAFEEGSDGSMLPLDT
ncbi:cysteine/serine-rich nuclear protein 2 [Huso huso]|uniref:Cysteine/serine-rich nuclear protein 2 n=1 Tax=Huso huso TaxID=61971 RepID=A0ABR0YEV1_HUSHU